MPINKLFLGYQNNEIPNHCKIVSSLNITDLNHYDLLNLILDINEKEISYLIYYTRTGAKQVYNLLGPRKKNMFRNIYMKKISERMLFSSDFGNQIYLNIIYDNEDNNFIFLILNMNKKFMNKHSKNNHEQLDELLEKMICTNYKNIYNSNTYSYVSKLEQFQEILEDIKFSYFKINHNKYINILKPIFQNPESLLLKTRSD